MTLQRGDLHDDPVIQFRAWFDDAVRAGQPEPEAMALATHGAGPGPSVRFVLLRGVGPDGFVFYTNRRSRKGRDLAAEGRAAAAFRWSAVDRQVRIAGPVEQLDDAASDAYFASRPRGSQLSAWASDQSEVVAGGEEELAARLAAVEARFGDGPVPRPPWWGGYRIMADEVEFWQQGRFRMHDRFRYRRGPAGWVIERLYP